MTQSNYFRSVDPPDPMRLVEYDGFLGDDLVVRCVVDERGDVWSFTVEAATMWVGADGVEADHGADPAYKVFVGGPITSNVLRGVPFDEAVNRAVSGGRAGWLLGPGQRVTAGDVADGRVELDADDLLARIRRRQDAHRAGRYPDGYYVEVAALYVALLGEGVAAPAKVLADRLGISYANAKNHVGRARELGFLAPRNPGPGRSVGFLTDKGRELLDGEGRDQ